MKKFFLLSIIIAFFGCKKENTNEGQWFDAEIISTGDINCGKNIPEIKILSDTLLAQSYLGKSWLNIYVATGLNSIYDIVNNKLRIKARLPVSNEFIACLTLGVNYNQIEVVETQNK